MISTAHLKTCQFVMADHEAQSCPRSVQWLKKLASKALDLENKFPTTKSLFLQSACWTMAKSWLDVLVDLELGRLEPGRLEQLRRYGDQIDEKILDREIRPLHLVQKTGHAMFSQSNLEICRPFFRNSTQVIWYMQLSPKDAKSSIG